MRHADLTDEELLVASPRDADAFEALFRRHAPAVLGFFARRVDGPETAADLMAETFAAALLSSARYRPAREPAVAWLWAIARNKLADHHRGEAAGLRALRRLGIERVALDDADIERVAQLAAAPDLAALPDDQRAAVEARVVEERSYGDIAAAAGTSEAVIRQRVSRGLRTLGKGLDRE